MPDWLELWSFGRYSLRLTDNEFWGLTLAQFNSLVARYRIMQESLDYRTALICAVVANVNRDPAKKRDPFQPEDFMSGRKIRKKLQPTRENMREQLKTVALAMGAEVQDGK